MSLDKPINAGVEQLRIGRIEIVAPTKTVPFIRIHGEASLVLEDGRVIDLGTRDNIIEPFEITELPKMAATNGMLNLSDPEAFPNALRTYIYEIVKERRPDLNPPA